MSTLDRVLLRIQEKRAALTRELAATRERAAAAGADRSSVVPVGTRVFDTVTGQEGEIIAGATERVIVPAAQQSQG